MTSISTRRRQDAEHQEEISLNLRCLNLATKVNWDLLPQKGFRPNMTVRHGFDLTTEDIVDFLIYFVRDNEDEFLRTITAKALIAFVSSIHGLKLKMPVLTLAIKWLKLNPLEPSMLNAVLMSIHVPRWPMEKTTRLRHGLYIYFTTEYLYKLFDIHLAEWNGLLMIRKKTDVPASEFPETLLEICREINKITDNHKNYFWNHATVRNDAETTKNKKKRQFIDYYHQLQNPLFNWDFDPDEVAEELKRPLPNRIVFSGYGPVNKNTGKPSVQSVVVDEKKTQKKQESGQKSVFSGYGPVNKNGKLMKPAGYQTEQKSSIVTNGQTSSGFGPVNQQKKLMKPANYKSEQKSNPSVITSSGYHSGLSPEKKQEKRGPKSRKKSRKMRLSTSSNGTDQGIVGDKDKQKKKENGNQQAHHQQHSKNSHNRKNENNNHADRIPINVRRIPHSPPKEEESKKNYHHSTDNNNNMEKPKDELKKPYYPSRHPNSSNQMGQKGPNYHHHPNQSGYQNQERKNYNYHQNQKMTSARPDWKNHSNHNVAAAHHKNQQFKKNYYPNQSTSSSQEKKPEWCKCQLKNCKMIDAHHKREKLGNPLLIQKPQRKSRPVIAVSPNPDEETKKIYASNEKESDRLCSKFQIDFDKNVVENRLA